MSQYEKSYIENNGEYYREISTTSFLAGVLFCKKRIDLVNEYAKLEKDFEVKYGIMINSQEYFDVNIVIRNLVIELVDDYDKVINVNGKLMDVRSYLYSLTTPEVREYFGINEPRSNVILNHLRYVFSKKNKTK